MDWSHISHYIDLGLELLKREGPHILLALAVLLVGLRMVKGVSRRLANALGRTSIDDSVKPFLRNLLGWLLRLLLLIVVAAILGVDTTSFVTLLGAMGLAIGLALRDSLANVAGGALLLSLKPYRLGDVVKMQDETGTVREIQVFHTILLTFDNKTVIMPNGAILNGNIINYTRQKNRRVDIQLNLAHNTDFGKVKALIAEIAAREPLIQAEPEPLFVAIEKISETGLKVVIRAWAHTEDYNTVYFYLLEEIQDAFRLHQIEMPLVGAR